MIIVSKKEYFYMSLITSTAVAFLALEKNNFMLQKVIRYINPNL
jgi:hypothetical protein